MMNESRQESPPITEEHSPHAPHSYTLYEAFCRILCKHEPRFLKISELGDKAEDRINIVVRHDIDHLGCVISLPTLLEIESRNSIASSSYIIVDGSRYDPRLAAPILSRYSEAGFEFGVHSNSYLYGNSFAAFERELEDFKKLYKRPAASFTQHGSGSVRQKERMRFNAGVVASRKDDQSLLPSDIGFPYSERFTDARSDESFRILTHTPESLDLELGALEPGSVLLFLTHPFRWCAYAYDFVTINAFNFNLFKG